MSVHVLELLFALLPLCGLGAVAWYFWRSTPLRGLRIEISEAGNSVVQERGPRAGLRQALKMRWYNLPGDWRTSLIYTGVGLAVVIVLLVTGGLLLVRIFRSPADWSVTSADGQLTWMFYTETNQYQVITELRNNKNNENYTISQGDWQPWSETYIVDTFWSADSKKFAVFEDFREGEKGPWMLHINSYAVQLEPLSVHRIKDARWVKKELQNQTNAANSGDRAKATKLLQLMESKGVF